MSDACGVDKMRRQFNQSPFSFSGSSNVKEKEKQTEVFLFDFVNFSLNYP